jgi:sugar transferase (PEP-CTERM/EpsH1 system associated)
MGQGKPTPPQIRIAHVLHSFDVGGLENGVLNLINQLDWQVYQHWLCCVTSSGRMAMRLQRNDVAIIELGKTQRNHWFTGVRLGALFRKIKPDIVHTRNWGAMDGILGARLARVPIVIHSEHGWTIGDVNGNNLKRARIRRILFRLADRIVTVSMQQRDWLTCQIGIKPFRITTICNGVDLTRFHRGARNDDVRKRWGFTEKEFVLGTVGRLDPIKNQANLIRAFGRLATKYPHIRLIIAGRGPCESELNQLVASLGLTGKCRLSGETDDVPKILAAMDLFVLPSISEGISNTILEAMASGLPVVATAVGGNQELVKDRETGLLLSGFAPDDLCPALDFYISRPAEANLHGLTARRRAEQEFSLNRMVASYDQLYRDIVA